MFILGSLDCTVKLWDFSKLAEDVSIEDVNVTHNPEIRSNTESYLLRTYATKSSPLISLQFSRRNVLLAVAMFDTNMWILTRQFFGYILNIVVYNHAQLFF